MTLLTHTPPSPTQATLAPEASPRFSSGAAKAAVGSMANIPVTNMTTVRSFLPTAIRDVQTKVNETSADYFFKPVIEDFLMGVMAIDFIALWLPRAWSALFRGAFDYKPENDPIARTKTGINEKAYVAKERFKRLNWPNFIEEWWREFASGPGMFVWPTFAYIGFRRYSPYRNALHLPRTAFTNMANFMGDHSKRHGLTSAKQLKMKPLMEEMIDWDKLFGKSTRIPQQKRASWRREFGVLLNNFEKTTEEKIALLNKNPNAWVFWSKDRKAFNKLFSAVQKSRTALTKKVHEVNSRYPGSRHMKHDTLPLKMPWGVGGGKTVGAGEFFQRMDELTHFVDWLKRKPGKAGKALKGALPEMIQQGRKSLLHTKGVSVVTATVATLVFLFKLVDWTQANDNYVANRNQDILDLLPSGDDEKTGNTPANPPTGQRANTSKPNPPQQPSLVPQSLSNPQLSASSPAMFRAQQWASSPVGGNPPIRQRVNVLTGEAVS